MLKFFNVSEEVNTENLEKKIESKINKQELKNEHNDPCIKTAHYKKKQPVKELVKK